VLSLLVLIINLFISDKKQTNPINWRMVEPVVLMTWRYSTRLITNVIYN